MFGGMERKELLLVYIVIGFGSVALVALGELSGVEPGGPLFKFYLNLVFGGLAVFYVAFVHFATLSYTRKVDRSKKSKRFKALFGEKASFAVSIGLSGAVLVFWIHNFAELMRALDLAFF